MSQEIIMTAKGYEELKKELLELKTIKRSQMAERIKTARGFGDLSENSEYDEAKNEQAIMEAQILNIEEQLKNVRIVDVNTISTDNVSVGCRVKILDIEMEEEMEYRIISSLESKQAMNTITVQSPVGQALLGHKVGETVDVQAPAGVFQVKILEINI